MKFRFYFLLLALFTAGIAHSQSSDATAGTITLFAEEGENFTVFMNGVQQNAQPMSNVKFDVKDASVQIRIVFTDASIPPLKKQIMRMGNDCTYSIKKNKKGEYTTSVKSCTGNMGGGTAPPVTPVAAPTNAGPLTAKVEGDYIMISDGRSLKVTKSKTSGGWPSPHVIMKAPVGAKVKITYDDGHNEFNTEVPFDYEVKDYNNNNVYFKLTVDEGGPDKTWSVRLQHGTAYQLTIE